MKISKLILSDVIKEEIELENILAKDPSIIEGGLSFIARQYATPVGAIDLLCLDRDLSQSDPVLNFSYLPSNNVA